MYALLLLLISVTASASELEVSTNGYSYYTFVSNDDMEDEGGRAAVNVDAHYYPLGRMSLQLSTNPLDAVQRLQYTNMLPTGDLETEIKLGRFNKIDGFYADAVDSPFSAGMAYLPQTVYDKDFVTSLSQMDGIQLNTKYREGDIRLSGAVSVGKPMMSEQAPLQKLVFDTTALAENVELVTDSDSYAFYAEASFGDYLDTFYEHSKYKAHAEQSKAGANIFEQAVIDLAVEGGQDLHLVSNRLGVKCAFTRDLFLTSEYQTTEFSVPDMGGIGWYLTANYAVDHSVRVFGGFGHSESDVEGKWNNDITFVGASKDYEEFFTIIEAHKMDGDSFTESKADEFGIAATIGYRW